MHLSELWNSVEKLGSLITVANWGIALTLLVAFACTAVVVEATSRKDAITGQEDLRKAAHIADLDTANLALRTKVATLEITAADASKGVAGLERQASDAKAAQQGVEIELDKQRERTAIAERDLDNLKMAMRPRRLTPEQKTHLAAILKGEPKGEIGISCVFGDAEGNDFATDIASVLHEAGWNKTSGSGQSAYAGGDPIGFGMLVHSDQNLPQYLLRLQRAFFSVGIPLQVQVDTSTAEGKPIILVGHKPAIPIQ